jgi:ribosomal protein S18 acetylase RimI-like enzyme
MEFRFTDTVRSEEVLAHLAKPRLWIEDSALEYPGYEQWLEVADRDLHSGMKMAMSGYYNGQYIGLVLFQRHKIRPTILEIKNVSLLPKVAKVSLRRRHVGSFLMHQVFAEASSYFPGVREAIVDTRENNLPMRSFLGAVGFREAERVMLYPESGQMDVVMRRRLENF